MTGRDQRDRDDGLLTARAVSILALAVFVALVMGGLTYLAESSVPRALLAGLASGGAAVAVLHQLVSRR